MRSMRPRALLASAALAATILPLGSCGTAPAREQPVGTDPAPVDDPDFTPPGLRLPTDVRPLGYAVDLTVIPGAARYGGTVEIRVSLDRPRRVVWVNGEDLTVTAATLGGRAATWTAIDGGLARVSLPADAAPEPAGETTLRITFDAGFSHGGDGVFAVSEEDRHYVLTTFEPISARKALPCFDEPGFKVPFDLTLTVPTDAVALASTSEVATTPVDGATRRVRFARTAPLPTYLLSFAVGPFDVVSAPALAPNASRAAPLPIRGGALAGRGPRLRDQLAAVGPLVAALEAWFASPYPYDKLDVVAVPGYPGAMENAALVLFDELLLMVDREHASLERQRDALGTLAHELAHQWFGNLVTMAWWDDLWLNEAFATWIANRMIAAVRPELGPETRRLDEWRSAMEADAKASARRIRQPIASQHDMYSAFDAITYQKGASLIAMFERWVGAGAWQEGVRGYLRAHAYGNATTDDLLAEVSRRVGRDIGPPFRSFLDAEGAPLVIITVGAPSHGTLPVSFEVSRWRPVGSKAAASGAWQVPVCLAGAGLDEARSCVLVTAARQDATLPFTADALAGFVPNAGGVGYYQALVRPETLRESELVRPRSSAEAAITASSYLAAFNSGALPAAAVLDALAPLAGSAEPELVRALLELLGRIGDHLVDDTTRPAFERRARALFARPLRRLGWSPKSPDEATGVRLLRASVIDFLAGTAREPAVRREAARLGRSVVGADGALHRERVAPEILATTLAVAVAEGDTAFFDRVMAALFASADPSLRKDLMYALAATKDPALAERARMLALDPRVTETEMLGPLKAQLADRQHRRAAVSWLEQHFDLVLARMPPFEVGFMPYLFTPLCGEGARAEVERFLGPRVEALPGAPQALLETLEVIALCTELVEAQGESVRAWLGSR